MTTKLLNYLVTI